MTDEPVIVDLMAQKLWGPIKQKYFSPHKATLAPYASVYEILGRRGFCKPETRMLGHFFQKRGHLVIAKHGWLIMPKTKF